MKDNEKESNPDADDGELIWTMITSGAQMDWKQTDTMYTLRAVCYKDPPAVMLCTQ